MLFLNTSTSLLCDFYHEYLKEMFKLRLFLLCFLPCYAFAQVKGQVAFRQLTVEQGLSQSSVVDIAQDNIGYMWFATQDGLNKYDGYNFTYYDINFQDITRSTYSKLGKIYLDKVGEVWVIPNNGKLKKYDREEDKFQSVESVQEVSTLLQTQNKNFYFGTFGDGIYKTDWLTKDTIQLLASKDAQRTVYDLLETDANTVWATTENGVLKINDSTYCFFEILQNTNFSALAESKNKTLYMGSYGNGLFFKKPDNNNFERFDGFSSFTLPKDLIIQDLLMDTHDRLWIATYGQGAYLVDFERKTIQEFNVNRNNPYALHYKDVLSLFEANMGTIWLGTDGAGLSYYDEYLVKFNLLTKDQVPLNVNLDVVRTITKTENDIIWVGTSGKGLTRLDIANKDFFTYTPKNSKLLGGRIMSLLYDDGMLWIGHQTKGLQIMEDNGEIKTFKETKGFTIWKIFKDKNNHHWLCTRNHGLIKFDREKGIIKWFSKENSALTTNNIRTLEQGEGSTLWIGGERDGLFKLDTEAQQIENIAKVNSEIKSLYFEEPILWIGTNGEGLKSYDTKNKTVTTFSQENGLSNNVIYGILPDSECSLWLSSNKGITQFEFDGNSANILNYRGYDGLQALEFNTGAYYKDDDGTLYFGGLHGINWFKPHQLSLNPLKPKTVISGFEVFGEKRKLKENQKLKHTENTITFMFSSLQFSQPKRNNYKYKLINNDEDWIYVGNETRAHYTNLPPNNYEFQVLSSNYDGIWGTHPDTYSFTILNPWYTTVLAKISYVLLFVLITFYLYRYLKWRWEIKLQLRFEQGETIRLKKLNEFKTKLYTNISHEFRTPLTLISGPVDSQLSKSKISKKDKKELSLIKQNADRLLNLVDQMLDLAIIESGQQKLAVDEGNLTIFLKQILSAFRYGAKQKRITFEGEIKDLDKVWFDRDVVEKVVSNLLSNAIKYAPTGSKIDFEARRKGETVLLSVLNETSSGNDKDLEKLFQRFYQNDKLSKGVGVGLALVKELVTLSKGKITVDKAADNRIHFKVVLPIDKNTFGSENLIVKEQENISETSIQQTKKMASESKPLLLLVEDEPELRAFIKSIFQDDYQITEAENGKIGIEKALNVLPDLIISDIMMPVQDGIVLCNTLKTNKLTSHIPIILLTAKVGEESEMEGLKTGADAYLTKPFRQENLKIRVEKLIENRRRLQNHFAKTLSIDPERAITSTESEFLKQLQKVLKENVTDSNFKIDNFADYMNLSRTQLHRKLKAITGMSASEFIRSQRLNMATNLLKESDISISEIAYQVGFNSVSYFNNCFKNIYKCTPGEYAKKT